MTPFFNSKETFAKRKQKQRKREYDTFIRNMGNKSSTKDDRGLDDSDFEKVEATSTNSTNPNDMASSGVLVEKPHGHQEPSSGPAVASNRRRIIKATPPPSSSVSTSVTAGVSSAESGEDDGSEHHSSSHQDTTIISKSNDEALLKESIDQSRAKRMQQLAADQKTKREKQQKQRRENPQSIEAKANPFSKFLSAFSVEAKFPSHKRAHSSVEESEQPPPKLPRVDDGNSGNENEDALSLLKENIFYVAVAAVASAAVFVLFRRKK